MTIYSLDIFLSQAGASLLYSFLTVASRPAYKFLRRQVRWSDSPISLRIFTVCVIHIVKGSRSSQYRSQYRSIVNEAEVDDFLELPCFLHDPTNVDNLISGFSAFSKPSLYIWKSSVQILLKPRLKDIGHNLAST